MFRYLISGARVVDGTGIPGFKADVAIEEEKIVSVSATRLKDEAEITIEGNGLVLCPGFVDMHSHADVAMFTDPHCSNLVFQGVTLALVGNCGMTPVPLNDEIRNEWRQKGLHDPPWLDFGGYLSAVEKARFSINVATLIGHNSIRSYVMGQYARREPSSSEMEQMKSIVDEAMKAGAMGMSTGLIYTPGVYAKTEEIIELCKVVAKWGGIYISHIRGTANELLQAVTEAIKIAEEAEVSTQLSHHKADNRVNWGLTRQTLQMMVDANRRGANVTCDFFPYASRGLGGGIPLPRWASPLYLPKSEADSMINNPEMREKIKEQLKQGTRLDPAYRSYEPIDNLEDVIITIYPGHPELQGKTLVEAAKIDGTDDPYEFLLQTVTSEKTFSLTALDCWEEDVRNLVKSTLAMIGTDSSFVDDIGRPVSMPRAYGSYPRILGKYVRDEKLIGLEEAVMKMSSRPHAKLHMFDRGLVRPGFFADLVLFDPKTVTDKAEFDGRGAYPEGIEYVFVNGKLIVSQGHHTKATPGRLLLRGSSLISKRPD